MNRLFLLYSVVFAILVIFSYAFIDPNFIFLKPFITHFAFRNRGIATGIYILLITVLIAVYLYFAVKERNSYRETIALLVKNKVLLLITILVFSYPSMLSHDIFNYITTAKVLFYYQENPYIIMPIEFLGDENLLFTHAANKTALYGPLWIVLTGIPFFLSLGNVLVFLFLLKVLVSMFLVGTAIVLHRITKNTASVVLFVFHPLVLIETVVSGHNDIVMMFFVLLSYYFFTRQKVFPALLCFGASVFIKYATLALLPVVVFLVLQILMHKKIDFPKVYVTSGIIMLFVFFMSFFREEIYPWYAIWFLPFAVLGTQYRYFLTTSLALSFGLLYKYVPYMYLATHTGVTPILKNISIVIFVIPALAFMFRKKIPWRKPFSQ